MSTDWHANLVSDDDRVLDVLANARRLAILGIKPANRSPKPAYTVPLFLQEQGYDIVPVPVYYPDVTEILGRRVYRSVAAIPNPVDMVVVFRRSRDIPPHLPDLLSARPAVAWLQLGIRHAEAARTLAEAGILVVQDRCTAVEHRKLVRSRRGRALN